MRKMKTSGKGRMAVAGLMGYVAAVVLLRQKYINWGAIEEEIAQALPGDALMECAQLPF